MDGLITSCEDKSTKHGILLNYVGLFKKIKIMNIKSGLAVDIRTLLMPSLLSGVLNKLLHYR